jgi:RNA polymerase sigma factor (sigma-70 family)
VANSKRRRNLYKYYTVWCRLNNFVTYIIAVSLKKESDAYLIEQYRNTSDNAYVGILFERYTHLVYGVCMKYLRDSDEAKDAVMAIFEKLLTDLKKHDIEFFKAWLHTVSKNHCLMLLRKAHIQTEFMDYHAVEFNEALHHEQAAELELKLSLLEKAIGTLDEHQQACIRMFYLEQKSYQQITDVTGYDYNQVKSYIQNGKRNLKIYMQKNERPA